jgi:hypothetical protein
VIIFGEKIGLKVIWIAGTVDVAFAISWNPCILGNVDAVSTMDDDDDDDDIIVPESNNDNVE